jgi:hypothetical protein
MTDFVPQKTDQLSETTNPYQGGILDYDSVLITTSAASGAGYSGTAQISLDKYSVSSVNDIDVIWEEPVGGGNTRYYKPLPFNEVDGSGVNSINAYYWITQGSFNGNSILTLNIALWYLTGTPGNPGAGLRTRFYYKVKASTTKK